MRLESFLWLLNDGEAAVGSIEDSLRSSNKGKAMVVRLESSLSSSNEKRKAAVESLDDSLPNCLARGSSSRWTPALGLGSAFHSYFVRRLRGLVNLRQIVNTSRIVY